jgi:hypothetical protein
MSALLAILVFAAVASPVSYRTTRQLGSWIAGPDGTPTIPGLLLHGLVFVILMAVLSALFGKRSGYLSNTLNGTTYTFMTRDDQDDQNTMHFQEDRFVFDSKSI